MRSETASTIIAALLLMSSPVSAHAKVTGVTFEPKSPIVGHDVTAIATDGQKHLTIDPEDWAKIRPGKPVVTWDEEVRLAYGVESAQREGGWRGKYVYIECPLGTKHLSIFKIDESHWALRERATSGQASLPGSRSSLREAD